MASVNGGRRRGSAERDQVDAILEQWRRERPDLDPSPMEIFGRILRASRYTERALEQVFKRFGLDLGLFNVLSALRRHGPTYRLSPSELNGWCMLTSGAMTKRLDRLEKAGLVVRRADPSDRRGVLVELSPAGLALIDQVVVAHIENESRLLTVLSPKMHEELAALLRRLLAHLEQEVGELPATPSGLVHDEPAKVV
ncbi:MAG TPA: MarR family transcriptional regulator [Gaiellaceae bacterium]|nr:MarR family transcriptional regulator [Gaiellaceae bacterium]